MKEQVLKSVDDAVAAGFAHTWACSLWQVSDDRVHRWRARRRDVGTLADRAPGGNPGHGILPGEIDAILAVAEVWGNVDRSHRKLAHRGSYEGLVWVAPSTFRRVLAAHGLVARSRPARGCRGIAAQEAERAQARRATRWSLAPRASPQQTHRAFQAVTVLHRALHWTAMERMTPHRAASSSPGSRSRS